MDGYSVEEAAEVLGIPQGRVWELIARGVLAGASEGRSDMRVFLRPSAGSGSPPPPAEDSGARANGGTHVEASPFRELLTEFRNLTERYGQALLALGEARGEVAALRSRVEVLEARMDMRLPLRAASTVAWELPDRYASERGAAEAATEEAPPAEEPEPMPDARAPSEPTAEAADTAPDAASDARVAEPQAPADEPAPEVTVVVHAEPAAADEVAAEEPEPPKRRVSGGRAAIAGLAEALARAEDPTLADLPGAREAGEALAALQRDVATTSEHEEGPQQPEPPPPEAAPEEPEPMVPDIPAAFATPMELPEEPAPEIPEPAAPEAEMPTAELPMPEAVAVAEPPGQPEPAEPPELAERAEPTAVAEPETFEPVEEPRPVEPASPYTTEVVEPDWFADGDFTWLDAGTADAAQAQPVEQEEPEAPPEPETPTEAEAPPDIEGSVEEEPNEPGEHEAEHIEAADEGPSVEALQDAFSEAPTADEPPPAEHEAEHETEHIEAADEGPSVEAIQDAFSEAPTADEPPPAEHEAQAAHPWPAIDRGGITSGDAVGFNLFREPARPAEPPAAERPPSASAEEELLWFGDEFEAADLEMETPGWRAGDRVPAEPATATVPPDVEPTETIIPDEEIERLAGDEGWDDAEVEAIRAYLGRTEVTAEADVPAPPSSTPPAEPPSRGPDGAERTTALLPDQDWLRGRRGPAATAYRRLRRLFQG